MTELVSCRKADERILYLEPDAKKISKTLSIILNFNILRRLRTNENQSYELFAKHQLSKGH